MGVALLVVALLAQPPDKPNGVSVDETLRRAVNEYAYGNYDTAIEQLRALLYPMRLVSDAQVIEARKYLALSYQLTDKPELMEEEFAKLLYLEPDYTLDPFSIPPSIIEAFEAIRTRLKPQLDAIRLRRVEASDGGTTASGPVVSTTLIERNDIVTLLPFGIGQFQNGDDGWGLFFALSEVVLLGVNIGAYMYARYNIGDDYDREDRGMVRALTVTQYASLAMFGIVWSLGIFQARLNFVPTVSGPPVGRDPTPGTRAVGPGALLTLDF
jgi:hypothetical protein